MPKPRTPEVLATAPTPDLPLPGPALRRALEEYPSATDGFGLTERLVLRVLAA